MKRFILASLLLAGFLAACNNADTQGKNATLQPDPQLGPEQVDSSTFTTIQWIDSVKQVGKINEGQKLVLSFRFKNTGDKPLIIQTVSPGCGCTVADKPERPIAPGNEAEIKGEFDSNGRVGMLHKTIVVTANTKGTQSHTLVFEGEVVAMKK
ncbi:DUF1573 domain-containing protein [Parasegetibacter sp. NRK P23]|uniref:DUF1573 domain-containing protein n=1 Tax=Parasegetibacter sp. NRK P23 TaxID=2942999 RepID=UPI0020443D58|nr:DUF1573 domain-containing protein [Parasegetibacter sp. NRK P23]MCM5528167.1 DUF1573 domain-containing protein [Parasegetibacter sp. NRK P23]